MKLEELKYTAGQLYAEQMRRDAEKSLLDSKKEESRKEFSSNTVTTPDFKTELAKFMKEGDRL